ncbi:hypothetical protein BDA99DRAFT_542762 [Phascolomyces articulosus]|uniref:FAD dependent oxidoreductase domain-containing protein n=1 Tax=Phascolomyces articulosus TaxID=60185 RepID=A0AAD5K0A3_9FUNG|nr:hypothetical protein BDA99DRAFT_542762 [Phascolomyces articulosus]
MTLVFMRFISTGKKMLICVNYLAYVNMLFFWISNSCIKIMLRKDSINVIVIGAGVIGLSTAVNLQLKEYRVTILANHFPGDPSNIEYTSPFAGAIWQSLTTGDKRQQQFDRDTFKLFWKLANGKANETGIMVIPAYNYYSNPSKSEKEPWFKDFVPTFRVLGKDDELPSGSTFGVHYTTVAVNPGIYLKWLFSQFITMGGQYKRVTLSHIFDAMDTSVDIVVNCSGMHAKTLGGVEDKTVVPTRGQNVIVHAPHIRKTVSFMSHGYVIPRSDGTVILGTTHEEYNMDTTVNPTSAEKVLELARTICPELTKKKDGTEIKLNIVGYITGIRPVRKGGPRVENEIMVSPSGKKIVVTHNYGHGAFGYISGWGSGIYATNLVEKSFAQLQKEKQDVISLFSRL